MTKFEISTWVNPKEHLGSNSEILMQYMVDILTPSDWEYLREISENPLLAIVELEALTRIRKQCMVPLLNRVREILIECEFYVPVKTKKDNRGKSISPYLFKKNYVAYSSNCSMDDWISDTNSGSKNESRSNLLYGT
jgi:hypothetical protein